MEAAAQWLREQGLAEVAKRDDREASQGAVAVVEGPRRGRHRRAALRDRLRGQGGRVRGRWPTTWPRWSRPRARTPSTERGRRGGAAGAPPSRRTSRSAGWSASRPGDGEVVDTYLHQQSGRGRERGGRGAAAAATRSWPTTSPCTVAFARPDVPAPRGRARGRGGRRARQTLEAISRNEGKPEAALRQDRRGPAERLVQGAGAARAALRPTTTSRPWPPCWVRPRSCASPRSSSAPEAAGSAGDPGGAACG